MSIDKSLLFNYPLTKTSDMPEDTQIEITEILISIYEKYKDELDRAADVMKSILEEKYGKIWHVIIGEGYGFDIHHVPKSLLHIYIDGSLGVTVWKC